MGRNHQTMGTQGLSTGTRPYANSTGRSQRASKRTAAATALGLGAPPQNAMPSGITGLQVLTQPSSLYSFFGSTGVNSLAGGTGLNTSLSTANSGTDILQIAALRGGWQHQSVSFQPAQLRQVRQALAQLHVAQVTANQAALAKLIEAGAQMKADEPVKAEEEKGEKGTRDTTTNDKPLDDDTAPRGPAGGQSQGARK